MITLDASLFPQQKAVKSSEWFTPAKYVNAAREVFGGVIDLDPASCKLANSIVQATRYYSKEDNGLSKAWYGNVWLNPPYSSERSTKGLCGGKLRGPTGHFISKLIYEFTAGNVSQAVACINADTVRSWFQPLWDYTLCFSSHPISFIRPLLKPEHHFFPTAFVYLGPHESRFIDVFSQFGRIAKAIDTPRSPVAHPTLWDERGVL